MNENNNLVTRNTSWDVKKLLLIAVGIPVIAVVVTILVMAGGPAVWQAIKTLWLIFFPNFGVVVGYVWFGVIGCLIGIIKAKTKK